ncbi:uncharacterized protein LAESUDRAFT_704910 [Laetiporus sulphureus 93-53]|uniref:DUF1365-domain-containing protein n=1 Tax=Laetiporus sulphureus 93-53 TaxID=1314785 RepID=A0A165CRH9_9APHY|nr:uncharacterized protein LAESUDRAFT_704910 [Laetiporus sulphureus 93-53]KZT03298.1 hypothetical protein LAESUDRAFT_704910 [Laetiporus sulphureus 93-53]
MISKFSSQYSENPSRHTGKAYILENTVSHCRLLPESSAHAFRYPTLSLLLSLNALEDHSLDLARGWLFGYGGIHGRLVGLRSSVYLAKDARSIRNKLLGTLAVHGFDCTLFSDAWMMTMPSLLGFEGINPLTVYFCYNMSEQLWLVVLEVHNTFGERHVYVLDIDKREGHNVSPGFQYQWTVPRQFHVSPFNDRFGFYVISVRPPPSSPSKCLHNHTASSPLPVIHVSFHLADPLSPSTLGPLKQTATLQVKSSIPFNSKNLLCSLARRPFVLMLTFARILYHAWILHYVKRLDVYPRPEPMPAQQGWGGSGATCNGGVGWQSETLLEQYARKRVEAFLRRRVDETEIQVTLVAADPTVASRTFSPTPKKQSDSGSEGHTLTIWYSSPQFFTTLFLAPSLPLAVLLGYSTERLFVPSSGSLLAALFTADALLPPHRRSSLSQMLRMLVVPRRLLKMPSAMVPREHPLDPNGLLPTATNTLCVAILLLMTIQEYCLYRLARARFVVGQEPEYRWHRALDVVTCKKQWVKNSTTT